MLKRFEVGGFLTSFQDPVSDIQVQCRPKSTGHLSKMDTNEEVGMKCMKAQWPGSIYPYSNAKDVFAQIYRVRFRPGCHCLFPNVTSGRSCCHVGWWT